MIVAKGKRWHRRAGTVFVVAMLTMPATGTVLAMLKPSWLSVLGGGLTFYLVGRAWLTVHAPFRGSRLLLAVLMALGMGVAILGVSFALRAMEMPTGRLQGIPSWGYLVFTSFALLGTLLDLRLWLTERLVGKHRFVRHLWRMCLAMAIATMSFFIGQANLMPRPLRHFELLIIPVLVAIGLSLYWLTRTLRGRSPYVAILPINQSIPSKDVSSRHQIDHQLIEFENRRYASTSKAPTTMRKSL